MASFCAKCGAALTTSEQPCPSCGAAEAAPLTAAPFVAAPPKQGSSTLKIILIIVAVIVGLGILCVGTLGFIAYRVAKNMHVDPSGRTSMTILGSTVTSTPNDNMTASDLGVDLYPGAQSAHGGMKMEMPNASVVTGVFLTSDSTGQVVNFYTDKLRAGNTADAVSVTQKSDHAVVSLHKGQQESIVVTITANGARDNGKTRITIMHMKNNKAS